MEDGNECYCNYYIATMFKKKKILSNIPQVGFEPMICSRRKEAGAFNTSGHTASLRIEEYFRFLNYMKNRPTLSGLQGQECN